MSGANRPDTVSEANRPQGDSAFAVVRGDPSEEELAALVVALCTGGVQEAPTAPPAPSGWSSRARAVRAPLTAGPGAWQASARPH